MMDDTSTGREGTLFHYSLVGTTSGEPQDPGGAALVALRVKESMPELAMMHRWLDNWEGTALWP
jgi:hypothetical protein